MSNEMPPKRDSLLSNPQVLAAVIGGIVTVVVAIIGILPALVNSTPTPTPQPTILVITVTSETSSILAPVADVEPTTAIIPATQLTASSTDSSILLLYDDVSFTLRNQSEQMVSLEGITFSSVSGQWEARDWGPGVHDKLPAGQCLRLRDATVGQRQPPAACRDNIFGLQEVGTSALFWLGVDNFDVLKGDQVIATCQSADGSCLVNV